ncbi:hypothetical protein [Desemzia sp. FAM 24101]|uniref:hypothetical protein n=1 Tax=unclassified Desemzia TaxID=2685243 RepID=UPI00388A68EF
MHVFKKIEISTKDFEEFKNQWFSMEEAIEELAINGETLSKSSFNRIANQVHCNKEIFELGKPEIKNTKLEGKGRPRKEYNRAFVEAIRSLAISDTFRKIEEAPVDFFISDNWKKDIEEEFKEALKNYIDKKEVYGAVEVLTRIVGENIVQKYNALIGQNKLLIHQNRKLEDTKEYYIAVHRGVEENANVVNDITNFIKRDISESSNLLSRKESAHMETTLSVNRKLGEILKALEDLKNNSK